MPTSLRIKVFIRQTSMSLRFITLLQLYLWIEFLSISILFLLHPVVSLIALVGTGCFLSLPLWDPCWGPSLSGTKMLELAGVLQRVGPVVMSTLDLLPTQDKTLTSILLCRNDSMIILSLHSGLLFFLQSSWLLHPVGLSKPLCSSSSNVIIARLNVPFLY